jgi:hypothetical protein
MFCPNCGANNLTEQKFCRACGLNLEKTAESMLEQLPSADMANFLKHERMLEKFGTIAWGGFGVVLFIAIGGIIYAIITAMILSGKQPWAGVLLVAFIIFAVLSLAYVILADELKGKKKNRNLLTKSELAEPKTTGKLLEEKRFEPVPSVTENSTELLPAKKKPEKFDEFARRSKFFSPNLHK